MRVNERCFLWAPCKMPSLLCFVPGFGPPQIDLKQRLIAQNKSLIESTFSGTVEFRVFNYGTVSCGIVCRETFEPGYLGTFIYKHGSPDQLNASDYVLLLLDDIELPPDFNTDAMINRLHTHKLDILSPSLTHGSPYSHELMRCPSGGPLPQLRITNFVELFCMLMPLHAYTRYHALYDASSAWCWGIDLALNLHGFRMGLTDQSPAQHHIHGASYTTSAPDAHKEMEQNASRLGRIEEQITLETILMG